MMCYNTTHIVTAGTRLGIVKNVFAERRELESPFRDVVPIFIRAFLLPKISSFKRLFLDSLRVDKEIKPNLERVKEFSPEMDFFSSSTVMPQRDLTGQDYFLITLPTISKFYMVSQERKR